MAAVIFLAAGISLLDREIARRLGGAGVLAIALGLAAAAQSGGRSAPTTFLAVSAGLVGLGVALCIAALVTGRRESATWARVGQIGTAGGTVLALAELRHLMGQAAPVAALGAAGALTVAVATTGWVAGRSGLGSAIRRRAGPELPAGVPLGLAALVASALAAAVGTHILGLLGGGMLAAWAAWLALPPPRPLPLAAMLVTLFLGATLWLLATIAGPEGLAISAVRWLPLSPAAERLVAFWILGAAWALSGLWPLRLPGDGALTAPVGVLLLVRLGLAAVPHGLEQWRAAAFPLVLLGIWHAAVVRRITGLAVGAALLGVVSLNRMGVSGSAWLLAAAIGLELLPHLRATVAAGGEPLARAVVAGTAAWGGASVLRAGLETEVVYTVLAVLAAALALAGSPVALTPSGGRSIFGAETR